MPRKRITKTQRIIGYYTSHPQAKPKEAAQALKRFGITSGYVANLRSKLKHNRMAGTNSKRRKRRTRQVAEVPVTQGLMAAARLIKIVGDVEQAKKAVVAAQAIADEIY